MSRWHQSWCNDPDVYLDENERIPHCKSCSSAWSGVISALDVNASAPLQLPPNEAPGHLNLWWPRSVSYTRSSDDTASGVNTTTEKYIDAIEQGEPQPKDSETGDTWKAEFPDGESYNLLPAIYGKLAPGEFRIAYLSGSQDKDLPIHLSLESRVLADSLDYETMSYTWGGENDDYARSQPVFIGLYWDILLQTRNCWDMLQFLRPKLGRREIWVDAVCINQHDIRERGEQVSLMSKIYEQCSRVIVYLGSDLVRSQWDGWSSRHRLHELATSETSGMPDLREILNRKYFTRVWIIQELVLAQRVIISIGDRDFWADSSTSWQESDNTGAAWVQYIAQKSLPVDSLLALGQITSDSHASDPRDKLFAVLGLWQDQARSSVFPPDYTLSTQHVFVGLSAHMIINEGAYHLLLHAAGTNSASSFSPSWVPNWMSHRSWRDIFFRPEFVPGEVLDRIAKIAGHKCFRSMRRNCFNVKHQQGCDQGTWHQDPSVDAATGALSIYLTHICRLSYRPVKVGEWDNLGIYELRRPQTRIFLVSCLPLKVISNPETDHVFMLGVENAQSLFFILRPLAGTNMHRLVAPVQYLVFETGHESNTFKPVESDPEILNWVQSDLGEQYKKVYPLAAIDMGSMFVEARVRLSPTSANQFGRRRRSGSVRRLPFECFFPDQHPENVLLALRSALCQIEHSSPPPEFEADYVSCLDPALKPQTTDGGAIEMTLKRGQLNFFIYTSTFRL